MIKSILFVITLITLISYNITNAAGDRMWECYSPCYDRYSEPLKQATTQEEKNQILAQRAKCVDECLPGRAPAKRQEPNVTYP